MSSLETLSSSPVFEGIDSEYLKPLYHDSLKVDVAKDEYVFHQGDVGNGLYVILEGKLDVILETNGSKESKNQVIATLEKGTVFGEISILTRDRRTASIQAIEKSKLLYIDIDLFQKYLNDENKTALRISHNIAIILAKRLEKAIELINTIKSQSQKQETQKEMAMYKQRLLSEVLI